MVVLTFLETSLGGCLDRTAKKEEDGNSLGNISAHDDTNTIHKFYISVLYSGIYQHLNRF